MTRVEAVVSLVLGGALVSAVAYGDDAAKCEAAKLKIAGKYEFCRSKAWANAAKTGGMPDYSKCDAKFGQKWKAAETTGNGMCPTTGDAVSIQTRITTDSSDLAVLLSGGIVPVCGNGVIEGGEQCDFNNLNGQTCQTQGFVAGQLSCTTSTCVFDTSGCFATRFVDNGDGTVTDHQTGLMWEQKTGSRGYEVDCTIHGSCSDPHDVNNVYSWSDSPEGAADGTTFTDFLAALNASFAASLPLLTITGCFATHCDWRLPTIAELQAIVDLEKYMQGNCGLGVVACIDPAFGPTQPEFYESATSVGPSNTALMLCATFNGNSVNFFQKFANGFYVRAVRGGS
jgi:hypothetical protein